MDSLFFSFAMRLTRNKDDARDLMQETTMRAFASRFKFEEGTNFKAWITTIMRNAYINEYRKQKTRHKLTQALNSNTSSLNFDAVQNSGPSTIMLKELSDMLDNLGDIHRIPFQMFFNGYEYIEIAEILGLPMGTVKSRIFFARKKMKAMIRYQFGSESLLCA
ncbi:MAG: RNA polymerase sigma factor [Saprospiraceae bacterium]